MSIPDAFRLDVRRELDPRGTLESLVADLAVVTAWRLRDQVERGAEYGAVPTLVALRDTLDVLDFLRRRGPARPMGTDPDPAVVVFDPTFDGDASDWSELPGWIEEPDAR